MAQKKLPSPPVVVAHDDVLLTTEQAAEFIKSSPSALRTARSRRKPGWPQPLYFGAKVLYKRSDLIACLRTTREEVAA